MLSYRQPRRMLRLSLRWRLIRRPHSRPMPRLSLRPRPIRRRRPPPILRLSLRKRLGFSSVPAPVSDALPRVAVSTPASEPVAVSAAKLESFSVAGRPAPLPVTSGQSQSEAASGASGPEAVCVVLASSNSGEGGNAGLAANPLTGALAHSPVSPVSPAASPAAVHGIVVAPGDNLAAASRSVARPLPLAAASISYYVDATMKTPNTGIEPVAASPVGATPALATERTAAPVVSMSDAPATGSLPRSAYDLVFKQIEDDAHGVGEDFVTPTLDLAEIGVSVPLRHSRRLVARRPARKRSRSLEQEGDEGGCRRGAGRFWTDLRQPPPSPSRWT